MTIMGWAISRDVLIFRCETGKKAMHVHQDLIDRATLDRALLFYEISEDDLATAVSAMSESWKTEIAVRLSKLAMGLQDLATVAAEAERRFLDATAAPAFANGYALATPIFEAKLIWIFAAPDHRSATNNRSGYAVISSTLSDRGAGGPSVWRSRRISSHRGEVSSRLRLSRFNNRIDTAMRRVRAGVGTPRRRSRGPSRCPTLVLGWGAARSFERKTILRP